jgi:hypothetical protein
MRDLSVQGTLTPPERRPHGWLRGVAALLLPCVLLSGCFNNVPLQGSDPTPRTRVVVRLTPAGSDEVARQVGPRVVAIEGDVGEVREDVIQLFARVTEEQSGADAPWRGESVTIPRSAIASMEQRTLNRSRSVLLAGAIAGGALLLARLFGSGVFGSDDPDTGGGVPPQ